MYVKLWKSASTISYADTKQGKNLSFQNESTRTFGEGP